MTGVRLGLGEQFKPSLPSKVLATGLTLSSRFKVNTRRIRIGAAAMGLPLYNWDSIGGAPEGQSAGGWPEVELRRVFALMCLSALW